MRKQAPPAFDVRHLHYRVYPVTRAGAWQWNVEQLLRRWPLFTGHKVIAIATQEQNPAYKLDPPERVRAMFAGKDCEFIEARNNPRLREVSTFVPMLDVLSTRSSHNSAIFFGHTKGVTHYFDTRAAEIRWSDMLYKLCLDYWSVVSVRLGRFPAVGPLKKLGRCFDGSKSDWHYAGSFYWLRSEDLFARKWRRIDLTAHGSESYPSLHFERSEAAYLGWQAEAPEMNLYHMPHLERAERQVALWKRSHGRNRSRIG